VETKEFIVCGKLFLDIGFSFSKSVLGTDKADISEITSEQLTVVIIDAIAEGLGTFIQITKLLNHIA
jgi:hypothetical protein